MKKLLAILLTVMLVCSFAVSVFAEEAEVEVVDAVFASVVSGQVVESIRGGASIDVLYDGDFMENYNSTDFNGVGIVLIQNTVCTDVTTFPEYTYTLELSCKADIEALKIGFYEYYMAMIGLPKDNTIGVEVSDNCEDWDFVGDYTFDGEAENGEANGNIYEIELDKIVTGKYVRLTFAFGLSPFADTGKGVWEWHGFTELGVVATEAGQTVDVSEEESKEVSKEAKLPAEAWDVFDDSEVFFADGSNGKFQTEALGNPDGFAGAYAYDDEYLYFAMYTNYAPIGSEDHYGNGTSTLLRLWLNNNDEATVYTHFVDAIYNGTETPVLVAKKNTSLDSNSGAVIEDQTGFTAEAKVIDGRLLIQMKVPVAMIDSVGKDVKFYYNVANGASEEVVNNALLYPATTEFPYRATDWSNAIEIDLSAPAPTPETGDAGVIALAVVSVIALAGAVIVKKSK